MSAAAAPQIPPRPVRAQAAAAAGASHLPEIPPRPKRLDRSVSPGNFPRSPLNELPSAGLSQVISNHAPTLPRAPSVSHLPSIGQEGFEYANIQYEPSNPVSALGADAAAQTRSVGDDVLLHAPKPSLPQMSATKKVEAVTRTDSQQAADHGFGKPPTPLQDEHVPLRQVRTKNSFSRPGSSASHERRRSIAPDDEQGPAELGMRVPINPYLGDVQAPSPGPFGSALSPTPTGGSGKRHNRTRSGRDGLPPGSYGLHGHGVGPVDHFDKEWYAKHPEQAQHEELHGQGVYELMGSGRGNFALSSDDLNKIVRDTAHRGAGFGTAGNHLSYPDEQIGYEATEQYSSRGQLSGPSYLQKIHSNISQPAVESPLRKTSFPAEDVDVPSFTHSKESLSEKSDEAFEDENEGVHVGEPSQRYNKITGGEETIHESDWPTFNEEGELIDQYHAPILAEDEVARHGDNDHLHAAVEPMRRGSAFEYEPRSSGDVTPISRPTSRPGSIHGIHHLHSSLSRFTSHQDEERDFMHTPLEDVDEYEPLFPDEAGKKDLSHAERFKKRPDLLRHRFPSQDIWEDAPNSAMYVATVSTPDLPLQGQSTIKTVFEPPEAEAARKGEPSEQEKAKLIPAEEQLAKSKFAPHLRDDMLTRPGLQPRFPSQDIWEDSPDSQYLVTTVSTPPADEDQALTATAKPSIPPRPAARSKLLEERTTVPPAIPERPTRRTHAVPPADAKLTQVVVPAQTSIQESSPTDLRKVPSIPDRPKPQIPPRPAKKDSLDSLTKTASATSTGSTASVDTEKTVTSPPVAKAKPQIPPRPAQGTKIASLKGNFMTDLNQKLGLGPPKEKAKDSELQLEEAKPLEDARKSRARGPQRRAPAKSPAPDDKQAVHTFSSPKSIWHIASEGGLLSVHSHKYGEEPIATQDFEAVKAHMLEGKQDQMDQLTATGAPPPPIIDTAEESDPTAQVEAKDSTIVAPVELARNTAGEILDPVPEPREEKPDPLESKHLFDEELSLSQPTTASSGGVFGHDLERAEADPSKDVIPMSQHTTADTSVSGASLEKIESNKKAEDETVTLRNEQVNAPAPGVRSDNGPVSERQPRVSNVGKAGPMGSSAEQKAAGADRPHEPMNEEDVNYKKLEEMTAQADGKGHAPEEGSTKVVD